MRHWFTLILLASIFTLNAQNWQPLFHKKDLSDFQQLNGTADYRLEKDEIIGTSKLNTPNSFLATKKTYSDFILELEVFIEEGLNSGIQIRSATNDSLGYVFGYQVEIETSERRWAGGIYDEARRGWLYPLSRNEKGQNAWQNGQWNHYRIEAIGRTIKTWVNGIQCANLVDDWTAEGFIALQVHSIGKAAQEGKETRWRNLRILTENVAEYAAKSSDYAPEISYLNNELTEWEKANGWRLLWDGKTSTGWKGRFPINSNVCIEPELRHQIYTIDQFKNYELSVDFRMREYSGGGIGFGYRKDTLNAFPGYIFRIANDEIAVRKTQTLGALADIMLPVNLSENNRTEKRVAWNGQFNRARIVVRGSKVEHWLNEIKIVEIDVNNLAIEERLKNSYLSNFSISSYLPTGHISLHGGYGLEFKNIKIKELEE